MPETKVVVPTSHGARYAAQLVKHWGHSNPLLTTGPDWTEMTFGSTSYRMEVRADGLTASIIAADDVALDAAKAAFQEHIDRFAFREKPGLAWEWR